MRLFFHATSSDSHDTGHLASNLQDSTPHSLGWISSPFPTYPQVLTFAFEGCVVINSVKILSHKKFVSSKIELSIGIVPHGLPPSEKTAQFQLAGSVTFNSLSSFNPAIDRRMYSSIDLHATGSFIRLVVHSPVPNTGNLCGQVGIAALTIDGDVHLNESTRVMRSAPGPDFELLLHGIDLEDDFLHAEARDAGVDPDAERALRCIRRLLADAKSREDYDEAERLTGIIAQLTAAGRRLIGAESEKLRAVDREDYAIASSLKLEAANLRAQLEQLLKDATAPPRNATRLRS